MQKCLVMRWNGKRIVRWYHRNPNIAKKLKEIVTGENYLWLWCESVTVTLEFFLFSLFIFSFISQLVWVHLDWNFHRWFSIHKQENWCTVDPLSLKFCTSQHSYLVPLTNPPSDHEQLFQFNNKRVQNTFSIFTNFLQNIHIQDTQYNFFLKVTRKDKANK